MKRSSIITLLLLVGGAFADGLGDLSLKFDGVGSVYLDEEDMGITAQNGEGLFIEMLLEDGAPKIEGEFVGIQRVSVG